MAGNNRNSSLHLPEAMFLVENFARTAEGLKQLREWVKKETNYEVNTKTDFLLSMGIAKEVVKSLHQSQDAPHRDPPSLKETQSILLLTAMVKLNPTGHPFFNEVINVGGVPILIDFVDRIHAEVPNNILNNVLHILVNLAWKSGGTSSAVADAINGSRRTQTNLLSLVAYALFQLERDVSTAPIFLENLLLLMFNVLHRRRLPLSLEDLKNLLNVLDHVFLDTSVEARAPKCICLVGRIYRELFGKLDNAEERYDVIDEILTPSVPLMGRWVDLLGSSEQKEVKEAVIDMLLAITRLGSENHRAFIAGTGFVMHAKDLLSMNDAGMGNKVINLVGLLADADDSSSVMVDMFRVAEIIPLMVEHVRRVYGAPEPIPTCQA